MSRCVVVEPGTKECLEKLRKCFSANPLGTASALHRLFEQDPERVYSLAIPLLKDGTDSRVCRLLLTLLLQNTDFHLELCNPEKFSLLDAMSIARQAAGLDPALDLKLTQLLPRPDSASPDGPPGPDQNRVLKLLDAASAGTRLVPLISHLIDHPDGRVRSKAALLVGRRIQSARWVHRNLSQPDPRVRANVIESLWGTEAPGAADVLRHALSDPNNRVVGNAAVGLYLLNEPAIVSRILRMIGDRRSEFRATGAWVTGRIEDTRFLDGVKDLLGDPDELVRTNAQRAISRLEDAATKLNEVRPLDLHILKAHRLKSGDRLLRLTVADGDTTYLESLGQNQFVVWEDGRLIGDYQVQRSPHRQRLAIGMAVAPGEGVAPADAHAAEEGIRACLRLKRASHLWAIAKFDPPAQPACHFSWQSDQMAVESQTGRQALGFVSANELVLRQLRSFPQPAPRRPAVLHALHTLLDLARRTTDTRHLMLLLGPDWPKTADIGPAREKAVASSITVHAVLIGEPQTSHPLAELVFETGGELLRAEDRDMIPRLYPVLYRSLIDYYELTYKNAQEDESPTPMIRVAVRTPSGHGEVVATLHS